MVRARKLSETQEADLCKAYQDGHDTPELARRYGVGPQTVCNILERHGIKRRLPVSQRRRYKVVEDFFAEPLTERAAYWLGFLLADGYICHEVGKSPSVQLQLQVRDRPHLECFRDAIAPDSPIYEKKYMQIYKGRPRTLTAVSLYVRSKRVVADLARLGLVGRKTGRYAAPTVPPHLLPHVFRGYTDGDGTVCFREMKSELYPVVAWSGSTEFLRFLARWLDGNLGVGNGALYPITRAGDVSQLYYTGWNKVPRIVKCLYEGASVALGRKRAVAEQIVHEAGRRAIFSVTTNQLALWSA